MGLSLSKAFQFNQPVEKIDNEPPSTSTKSVVRNNKLNQSQVNLYPSKPQNRKAHETILCCDDHPDIITEEECTGRDIKDLTAEEIEVRFQNVCQKSIESINNLSGDVGIEIRKAILNYVDENAIRMRQYYLELKAYEEEATKEKPKILTPLNVETTVDSSHNESTV
ncbi:uncharacterized protein LOC119671306 [Teleopsis dalmanni]|uniref:uncharacterized protein LOC119671306 n=1 Tax=Teleopsis dalmanni TaxID=139649 RepID=UPI0018CF08B0|nr:uncharacterized protein LOC119671306 [Teleopsis dalmanni]